MFESSGICFSGQLRIRNVLQSAYRLPVISLQFIHKSTLISFVLLQCRNVTHHSLQYYILNQYFYSHIDCMNIAVSTYRRCWLSPPISNWESLPVNPWCGLLWGLDWREIGVRLLTGTGNSFVSTESSVLHGPAQPTLHWVYWALSLRIKDPGRELDHTPSSAKVRIMWRYTSAPLYIFMPRCVIMQGENFILFIYIYPVRSNTGILKGSLLFAG